MFYTNLRELANTYLHQDFEDVHGSAEGAVRQMRLGRAREVPGAIEELDVILRSSMSESELADLWTYRIRAESQPENDGLTYREWFQRMRDILAAPTDEADAIT